VHSRRASAETDPDRDWAIDKLTAVAPPSACIIYLMGGECSACAEGVDSPIRGFADPVILVGRRGCHRHQDGVVLIESRGSSALDQEGPPLLFVRFLLLLFLSLNSKGDVWVAIVVPR
jgi:hypothetical protein